MPSMRAQLLAKNAATETVSALSHLREAERFKLPCSPRRHAGDGSNIALDTNAPSRRSNDPLTDRHKFVD